MGKMYVVIVKCYMSGEDVPFNVTAPGISSDPDKLVESLQRLCKMHGAEEPHFTDFGWSFGYDGYHFLATIEDICVID